MENNTPDNSVVETQGTNIQDKSTKPSANVESAASPIENTETQQQINWKNFRETRELERKQKAEAEKRASEKEAEANALKAAMEALLNKPVPQSNNYQINDQSEETEEQRISRLVAQSMDAERKKDQIARQQREQVEFPQRLQKDLGDFDKVCTSDNLDYLEYHYPEVADAFKDLPDGYDKWSKVYKAVKRFVPNTQSHKEQAKAEKNFMKPQSMAIPGKTQTGDSAPQNLDDTRRAANWARMQKVMRGGQ